MESNGKTSTGHKITNFSFDWYQATVLDTSAEALINALLDNYDLSSACTIKGQNSYTDGISVQRGDNVIARVFWGGVNGHNPHIISTSDNSPDIAEFLRKNFPQHRVTRADVCEDYTGEGTWDLLYSSLEKFALLKNLRISQVGDYTRGENGRTLYIGSPKSITYLRLYEKGHESGHPDKNWVRLELVVRPKKSQAREYFSIASTDAFFGASSWSLDLYTHLTSLNVSRVVSGTFRAPTDDEKAYKHLVKQYHKVLGRMVSEQGIKTVSERLFTDIINAHHNSEIVN